MANDTTAISPRWSVVSASAPANPFDGQLWRDTSADVLKQYDADTDAWETVQTSIDNITLRENTAGNVQNEQHTDRVGNFETDLGGWSPYDPAGELTFDGRTSANASDGSFSLRFRNTGNNDTEAGYQLTRDVPDGSTIRLQVRSESGDAANGDEIRIYVNGTVVATDTTFDNSFKEVSATVPDGVGGENATIRAVAFHSSASTSGYAQANIDEVRVEEPAEVSTVTATSDAGGVP